MQAYLSASTYIDLDHPAVARQAATLAESAASPLEVVQRCFEFVRDEIKHSADHMLDPESA